MRLYFDLDKGHFVTKAGYSGKLTRLDFKRGDATEIRLGFYRGTVQELLSGSPTLALMLKPEGKYDADAVVDSATWTNGTAGAMDYVCNPNFNTTELDDLLNSGDGNEDNDLESTDLMMEITWSEDGGTTWRSSDTVTARVFNDVVKGSEGAPTPGTPDYPSAAVVNAALVDLAQLVTDLGGIKTGYRSVVTGAGAATYDLDDDSLACLYVLDDDDVVDLDDVTSTGWLDVFATGADGLVQWSTGTVRDGLGGATLSSPYTIPSGAFVKLVHRDATHWELIDVRTHVADELA